MEGVLSAAHGEVYHFLSFCEMRSLQVLSRCSRAARQATHHHATRHARSLLQREFGVCTLRLGEVTSIADMYRHVLREQSRQLILRRPSGEFEVPLHTVYHRPTKKARWNVTGIGCQRVLLVRHEGEVVDRRHEGAFERRIPALVWQR